MSHLSLSSHLTPQSCFWLAVKGSYKPLIGTRQLTRGWRLNKKNFCHQNIFFIGAIQYNLHSELTLQLFFTTATTPWYWSLIGHCDENTRVASDWSVLTQSRHISRLSCILMGANDLVNRLRERGGQCLSHDPHVEHGHYLRYLFPVCTELADRVTREEAEKNVLLTWTFDKTSGKFDLLPQEWPLYRELLPILRFIFVLAVRD